MSEVSAPCIKLLDAATKANVRGKVLDVFKRKGGPEALEDLTRCHQHLPGRMLSRQGSRNGIR